MVAFEETISERAHTAYPQQVVHVSTAEIHQIRRLNFRFESNLARGMDFGCH